MYTPEFSSPFSDPYPYDRISSDPERQDLSSQTHHTSKQNWLSNMTGLFASIWPKRSPSPQHIPSDHNDISRELSQICIATPPKRKHTEAENQQLKQLFENTRKCYFNQNDETPISEVIELFSKLMRTWDAYTLTPAKRLQRGAWHFELGELHRKVGSLFTAIGHYEKGALDGSSQSISMLYHIATDKQVTSLYQTAAANAAEGAEKSWMSVNQIEIN
jgi:hypothetical protein